MRFRFSLRTFFLLLAVVACVCYVWLTRPSQIAQQFADAVSNEDFQAADHLFRRSEDRFLADWAKKRWAFRAGCELRPLTFKQLLTAQREVEVSISYFEFDSTATRQARMSASPFGLASPSVSSVNYGGRVIDERRESMRINPRR